jgi:hypothetical protein
MICENIEIQELLQRKFIKINCWEGGGDRVIGIVTRSRERKEKGHCAGQDSK